jgi:hypothetical protein
MPPPDEQQEPMTPFERGFYALVLTVILGLFAADIIRDYVPAKLAILFFLLFMPPLLVLHEAGHALMAHLLGWRVRIIVIGMHRQVTWFRVGRVPVFINMLPLSGYVIPTPVNLNYPRLKLALIYFAGPGIELLLLAILVAVLGPQVFLTRSDDIGVLALQALAIAILYGAILNLVPIPFPSQAGSAASDGLGILRSLTLSDGELREMILSPEVEKRLEEWWEQGDEGWATDRDPDRWP